MSEYGAGQISILKGLEAVQKRPGMYVGDVTTVAATHHLLYEIFDNSVDEALAGHANNVSVILHADGSATVRDDGRGIPVGIHPEEGVSAAEVVLTTLHAGGKFDNDAYAFSGGLHGVGSACTNALSDYLDLRVKRDGKVWEARFEEGKTVISVHEVAELGKKEGTGTEIRFHPSEKYLRDTRFVSETLMRRFREVAYLNPGIRITFRDERTDPQIYEVYDFPGGVRDLVADAVGEEPLVAPIITVSGSHEGVLVDAAFAWRAGDVPEQVSAYANNIPQPDGGQHLTGLRSALVKSLLAYGDRNKLIKRSSQVSSEDLREGVMGTVHVKIRNPAFSSQTKEKLISTEARTATESVVGGVLDKWLDENPQEARNIIGRAQAAAEAREAAKKARELTRTKKVGGRVSVLSLPEKLADCSSRTPEERELFLVEGDSAGGSAKQGRDREKQAILPLRGKILNVERAKASAAFKNAEIAGIIQTLAAGTGDKMDLSGLRYHKLVIMTDADVDGSHIATLILTLLYRHMRPLVEAGHVYLAVPPLYRIRRKGEEDMFVSNDADMTRNFVSRALSGGLMTINGETAEERLILDLESLIQAEDRFQDAVRAFQNPQLAEAALGAVSGGFGKMSKTAVNGFKKSLLSGLTANDEDATWTVEVSTEDGVTSLRAHREEDGVEEEFVISPEVLNGYAIKSVSEAWDNAGLFGSDLRVADVKVHGPIDLMRALREAGGKSAVVSRYKGLGEMNAEELWETTMNPETRRLQRVTIPDAERADAIFADLMADNVSARRSLVDEMFVSSGAQERLS